MYKTAIQAKIQSHTENTKINGHNHRTFVDMLLEIRCSYVDPTFSQAKPIHML